MRIKTFSLYIALTRRFIRAYRQEALDALDYLVTIGSSDFLFEQQLVQRLTPIFNKYFNECIQASNTLVSQNIATLSNALRVPFKYNRQVIDHLNSIHVRQVAGAINYDSIFKGYFNPQYTQGFTRREIGKLTTELKKVVLRGTYGDVSEAELIRQIREAGANTIGKTANMTENRARMLARGETSRLRNGVKDIYFQDPDVQAEYDLVWVSALLPTTRDEHKELHGVKADSDGAFRNSNGEYHSPPIAPNCMCQTEFVSKIT